MPEDQETALLLCGRSGNCIYMDDAMSGKAASAAESIMQWVKSVAGKPKE